MTAGMPEFGTLADRVNWLISLAHPPGGRPLTDGELAREIARVTGRRVTPAAIWKLRNGKTTHPSWELVDGLARALGVPADWFSGQMDEAGARALEKDIRLVAQLRDLGVTAVHLSTIRDADAGTREMIIKVIEVTAQAADARPSDADPGHQP